MSNKLTMLMILDGFGNNPNKNGNAIEMWWRKDKNDRGWKGASDGE